MATRRERVMALFVSICILPGFFETIAGNTCPPNYEGRPNSKACYKFVTENDVTMNWFDARSACEADTADLLVIHSAEEKDWLHSKIRSLDGISQLWVGLNNNYNKTVWQWVDESVLNVNSIRWRPGYPKKEPRKQNCVAMDDHGLLFDETCGKRNLFICELSGAATCPSGWISRQRDSCYLFGSYKSSQSTSRETCKEYNADLLKIETQEERSWVIRQMGVRANSTWWIGLDDEEIEGRFIWTDGTLPDFDILVWADGEPNNMELEENCGTILTKVAVLSTSVCHRSLPFICKKSPLGGTTDQENWKTTSEVAFNVHVTEKPSPAVTAAPSISYVPSCPPLELDQSTNITCIHSGTKEKAACNISLPIGSEAEYRCARFYTSSYDGVRIRKCLTDRKWSSLRGYACTPMCGKKFGLQDVEVPFITFGTAANPEDWPWHAALFFRTRTGSWTYICGGTLISEYSIITAAHCVTYPRTNNKFAIHLIRVHLGKENSTYDEFTERTQQPTIQNIFVHEDYTPAGLLNDIAIITFSDPVKLTKYVRPICYPRISSLSNRFTFDNGIEGVVVGWGKDENYNLPTTLRMAFLKLPANLSCSTSGLNEAADKHRDGVTTTFCAGGERGVNVCNGDSGSGWVSTHGAPDDVQHGPTWILQGIVSKGQGLRNLSQACDYNSPAVFTRVGSYAVWIERTLAGAERALS